jgi:hypothetical protein
MIVMPRKYKSDARKMKFPGKGLVLRLLAVRYGEKPRDKIDLFITALLRTFPGILRTRHPKMWVSSRARSQAYGALKSMVLSTSLEIT